MKSDDPEPLLHENRLPNDELRARFTECVVRAHADGAGRFEVAATLLGLAAAEFLLLGAEPEAFGKTAELTMRGIEFGKGDVQ